MTKSTIEQELEKSIPKIDLRKEEGSYLCDGDYEGNGNLFVTVDNVRMVIQKAVKQAQNIINKYYNIVGDEDYETGEIPKEKAIQIIKDLFG